MNNGWNMPRDNQVGYMNRYMLPHYEIIEVNGEAGANSIKMAPNSSIILADKTGATVWFAATDGAGYLTVTPYDLVPHQSQPTISVEDLAQRVSQLEDIINAKQSNSQSTKQNKRQQQQQQQQSTQSTTI